MANKIEKYARLLKSNTLFSSTESMNGCEDATLGVRCKTKAEIKSSRRTKRESIADNNRNRFDVDLYDELSETLNQQKKLTRIIKAADDLDLIIVEQEEENEEEEIQEKNIHMNISAKSTASTSKTNVSFNRVANLSNAGPLTTPSSICNLARANTIATSNRKKLLEEWRKKREENEMKMNTKKPLFKVCHIEVKDYALPPTPLFVHSSSMPTSNFTFKLNAQSPAPSSKFKNSVSVGNLGKSSLISSASSSRQNVSSSSSHTSNNSSIAFTATANERPLTRGQSVRLAESKAAVTRIAPNGIFSQVKTSAFFKSTEQTPTLPSSSSSRPYNRNLATTNHNHQNQQQQQHRLPSQPVSKPQPPQRPPVPPPQNHRPTKTTAVSARGAPPPIPPRPLRQTNKMGSSLPSQPPSLPPSSSNATVLIEADLTMLRGTTSSSNILNSTKIDDTCNMQPNGAPLISQTLSRLSITQMVEQSNIITHKEIENLTNKLENASIVLSNNQNDDKSKFGVLNKISSPVAAKNEIKTPTPTPSRSNCVSTVGQQTPKSITIDLKSSRHSGHDLKEFLKKNEECNSALNLKYEKEETFSKQVPSPTREEEGDDNVIVKDIKYYKHLVQSNTDLLNGLSSKWLSETSNPTSQIPPPDDVQGDIRSACGLAKLLIDERFDQFSDLIRQAEAYIQSSMVPPTDPSSLKTDEEMAPIATQKVLTSDLEGFWEMIEIQIKNVEKKFEYLTKLKDNDYQPLPIEIIKPSNNGYSKSINKQASFKPRTIKVNTDIVEKPKLNAEPKKPKQSFASFRANLKANTKQSSENEIDIAISVVEPQPKSQPAETINAIISIQPATPLTESRRRSSRLLGLKPTTPCELNKTEINSKLLLETQLARSGRKGNQRRSDLIKWDDTPQHQQTTAAKLDVMHEDNESGGNDVTTAKNTAINSNYDWLNSPFISVNKSSKKATASGSVNYVENKENLILDDVDDFLSFEDAAPMKIKRDSIAPKYLTPNLQRKSLSNANRVSLSANTNVINSPLLKIALISSQGKRLSTNMNANSSHLL